MKDRFTLRLEKELLTDIKVRAVKEGRNVNEIIEELLLTYLNTSYRGFDDILKELKAMVGKEYELSVMDCTIIGIVKTNKVSSIFQESPQVYIDLGEFHYTAFESEGYSRDVKVKFQVLDDNKNLSDVLVKVTSITEVDG